MRNPYEALGRKKLDNPEGEEVTGALSCQERGCYNVATEGRYIREAKLLFWECKDGHMSKIEGYEIE